MVVENGNPCGAPFYFDPIPFSSGFKLFLKISENLFLKYLFAITINQKLWFAFLNQLKMAVSHKTISLKTDP